MMVYVYERLSDSTTSYVEHVLQGIQRDFDSKARFETRNSQNRSLDGENILSQTEGGSYGCQREEGDECQLE